MDVDDLAHQHNHYLFLFFVHSVNTYLLLILLVVQTHQYRKMQIGCAFFIFRYWGAYYYRHPFIFCPAFQVPWLIFTLKSS
jgi:hypothetical protein